MSNDDYDPVTMGRVLARLDNQDKVLAELQEDMEVLMTHLHRRDGMRKVLFGVVTVCSFLIGNVVQWFIFRGPGHS